MNILIDWISFTVPWLPSNPLDDLYEDKVEMALRDLLGRDVSDLLFEPTWHMREGGRQPFGVGWDVNGSGIAVFTGESIPYILVEISGKGCEFLRRNNVEGLVLRDAQERVTRIDIACDLKTDKSPAEFAPKRAYGKTKSYTEWNSPTGQTVYIGSMQSETYVRVYRYAQPHPRHALLRVEFVYRRKLAQAVAREIEIAGIQNILAWSAKKIGLSDSAWDSIEVRPVDVAYPRAKKADVSSLIWLMKQVAPRFKTLVDEGVIPDAEQFLRDYFLS